MREELGALERELSLLGGTVAYPATPQLAAAVRRRIAAPTRPGPAPAWGFAGAVAATVIVALAVVAGTIAPARDALADLFDRINIFEVEEVPESLPTDIPGEPVTLEEAERRLGLPIALPSHPADAASSLTRALFQDLRPGELQSVALFFAPAGRPPFILFQTNAGAGKGLGPGAEATPVPGLGQEAYWLEGLRIVQLYDSQGNFIRESQRQTDANTLLWVGADGFVYRIEGDLPQDEAVRIAQSLR